MTRTVTQRISKRDPAHLLTLTLVIIVSVFAAGCGCNRSNSTVSATDSIPFEKLDLDSDSAAAHYYQNAEVYSVRDASGSEGALIESAVVAELSERGFEGLLVTTHYGPDGEMCDETEVSPDGEAVHPSYTALYESESGDLWTIYVNDGDFMAYPVSYNTRAGGTEVMVCEHEYITSYDGETGRFFRVRPTDGSCDIVTVDRIDAETLDSLSVVELGAKR